MKSMPDLKKSLFDDNGSPYLQQKDCDISETIKNQTSEIKQNIKVYQGFGKHLRGKILELKIMKDDF